MATRGKERLLIAFLCVFYVAISLSTRSHYGITWDAAGTDWYHAERHLNYFFTLDKNWIDFGLKMDPAPWDDHPELMNVSGPTRTLHFGNFLSAIGCRIFYRILGVDAVTAHHIPNFILIAGTMAAMFFFMRRFVGIGAATVAAIALPLQPHFFASAQFNTKDVPYACLMTFTLLLSRRAIIRRNATTLILSAILLGLSALTKPNAALIPIVLVGWYILSRKDIEVQLNKSGARPSRHFIPILLASPIIALAAFFAAWPYLWFNTIERVRLFIGHYLDVASSGPAGIQWDNLLLFHAVQPPLLLMLAGVGLVVAIVRAINGENRDRHVMLLLWVTLPVVRMILPHVRDYDGVRHFIEYAVPFAGLCGVGAEFVFVQAKSRAANAVSGMKRYLPQASYAIVAGVMLSCLAIDVSKHPHEITYFNFLVGGFKGANARWLDATDYWGYTYTDGARWLNEHAEPGALVIAPVGGYMLISLQRNLLRKDITVAEIWYTDKITASEILAQVKPEYRAKVYAIYVTKRGWYSNFTYEADATWRNVFEIESEGVPLMKIMKAGS